MAYYLYHGIAASTRRAYSSAQTQFVEFCHRRGFVNPDGNPLPASENTLCEWAVHLATRFSPRTGRFGVNPKTISAYLSAVSALHLEEGFPSVYSSGPPLLYRVLRGIKRNHAHVHARPRLPISYAILSGLVRCLDLSDGDSLVLAAACATGFFALLRSGEFTFASYAAFDPSWQLSRGALAFHPAGDPAPSLVELTIPSSKTDPFRTGVTLTIGLASDPACCAVRLLHRLCRTYPLASSAPLFSLPSGRPFSRTHLVDAIRLLLPRLGLQPEHYAGHSFRIGGATAAANMGYSDYEIKVLGRWVSHAYIPYLRLDTSRRAALASRLSTPVPPSGWAAASASSQRGIGASAQDTFAPFLPNPHLSLGTGHRAVE